MGHIGPGLIPPKTTLIHYVKQSFESHTVHPNPGCEHRACSCMGLTYVLDIFRGPETSIIADLDLEAAGLEDTVPLHAYGPYRSEYGRLGEFPNLPPLLVNILAHLSCEMLLRID